MGVCYAVEPDMEWWARTTPQGNPVGPDFSYTSDNNTVWLDRERLQAMLRDA